MKEFTRGEKGGHVLLSPQAGHSDRCSVRAGEKALTGAFGEQGQEGDGVALRGCGLFVLQEIVGLLYQIFFSL